MWHASAAQVWHHAAADFDELIVKLAFDPQSAEAKTAWPEIVFLHMQFPFDKPVVDLALQWVNKRANRMLEALWLSFQPAIDDPGQCQMSKLEQNVSPFDVVRGGNRHMHAVTGALLCQTASRRLSIESLDAAVVSLGERTPIYFSNQQPDLSKGLHYSLFNNGWGTNYIQWFGEDARFRFRLAFS